MGNLPANLLDIKLSGFVALVVNGYEKKANTRRCLVDRKLGESPVKAMEE